MPTNARRRHLVDTGGPWGTGLLLFGFGALMQGTGYLLRDERELPRALARFNSVVPIQVWAALWLIAGLFCSVKALMPPQRHRDVWPLVGITVLWACVYGVQWFVEIWQGGHWLSPTGTGAIGWASIASVLVCWGKCVNPPRVDQ